MYSSKPIDHLLKRLQKKFKCLRLQHTAAKTSAARPALGSDVEHVRPVFRYANDFSEKIALHDVNGEFSYRTIFNSSWKLSKDINKILGYKPNERVAFLCPNDCSYIITQWAAWMAGQIVVPLSSLHPPNMLEYYINDSNANLLVTTEEHSELFHSLSEKSKAKLLILDESLIKEALVQVEVKYVEKTEDKIVEPLMTRPPEALSTLDAGLEPEFYQSSNAMIIYTSGTTGPPKGVVLSHKNIHTQVHSMVNAWEWTRKDIILHTLPLHHVHGIINALITPLSVGAKIVMLPKFSTNDVWTHLLGVKKLPTDRISVFMGVPTMYSKLIEEFDTLFLNNKRQAEFIKSVLKQKIRLMVSGSAPLPGPVMERWEEISSQMLLERYGMTETGMVLSNPLKGERKTGFVGQPMPYVNVRIVNKENPSNILVEGNSSGSTVLEKPLPGKTISGDLWVKGPTVFRSYWNKPNATAKEFAPDEWFKTGDTAEYVDGWYKLLGRSSVDIIKTGGYKVSALEIETTLLGHEDIEDIAVVGVPDITWGEKVASVVVLKKERTLELSELREWCKQRLAPYAVPTELKVVEVIPRNAMGKMNKKELLKTLFVVK